MRLSQAIDYHSVVPIAGLAADGTWDEEVAVGGFLTFDRFITERSFGQKKRLFQTNSKGPIPDPYYVIRTPDGRRYIIISYNVDIGDGRAATTYNTVYLLQEAPYQAEILDFQVQAAASGAGGERTEVVVDTVYCDMERLSAIRSLEFDGLEYTNTVMTFPNGTSLNGDQELLINGTYYDIVEAWETMLAVQAKAVKRGTGV